MTLLKDWKDKILNERRYLQSSYRTVLATGYEGPVQNKNAGALVQKAGKMGHLVY